MISAVHDVEGETGHKKMIEVDEKLKKALITLEIVATAHFLDFEGFLSTRC